MRYIRVLAWIMIITILGCQGQDDNSKELYLLEKKREALGLQQIPIWPLKVEHNEYVFNNPNIDQELKVNDGCFAEKRVCLIKGQVVWEQDVYYSNEKGVINKGMEDEDFGYGELKIRYNYIKELWSFPIVTKCETCPIISSIDEVYSLSINFGGVLPKNIGNKIP